MVSEVSEEKLIVYPNPTSGQVTVKINFQESGNLEFRLFNSMGENIYSRQSDAKTGNELYNIDLKSFPTGVYFLEVIFQGNSQETNAERNVIKILKN